MKGIFSNSAANLRESFEVCKQIFSIFALIKINIVLSVIRNAHFEAKKIILFVP